MSNFTKTIRVGKVSLTLEELETITEQARLASTDFIGMGFSEGNIILSYVAKPTQIESIVDSVLLITMKR